ncbi:hypothetical protein Taro_042078 [Colocasia esculenta]|uniref:Uncharacterized protein n=1 Tax=Colocasia esculenta TaxID=4460 RepID=A0A843WVG9_COLES|nr:hypothetical protein [Colocasia esculenta]
MGLAGCATVCRQSWYVAAVQTSQGRRFDAEAADAARACGWAEVCAEVAAKPERCRDGAARGAGAMEGEAVQIRCEAGPCVQRKREAAIPREADAPGRGLEFDFGFGFSSLLCKGIELFLVASANSEGCEFLILLVFSRAGRELSGSMVRRFQRVSNSSCIQQSREGVVWFDGSEISERQFKNLML